MLSLKFGSADQIQAKAIYPIGGWPHFAMSFLMVHYLDLNNTHLIH